MLLPAHCAQVMKLDVQQGEEGRATERTVGVEVGVVGGPTGHDLLVVHQRFAGAALGTAGHQHLLAGRQQPSS